MASMVDADGGGLGSSTQRALTWKSLCVPSGEDDTHSGSLLSVLNSLQENSGFVPVPFSRLCQLLRLLLDSLACYQMSFFHSLFSFVMIVYVMTVILTAVLCCR